MIIEKIEKAKTLKEINDLRSDVIKSRNSIILKKWQDKYWSMKKCPTCGKIKGEK